jgi:hypothetical protein
MKRLVRSGGAWRKLDAAFDSGIVTWRGASASRMGEASAGRQILARDGQRRRPRRLRREVNGA